MVKCFRGKHKDLSLVPKTMEERKLEWQQELVTPRAGEAERDRQSPGASQPSLLAEFQASGRPYHIYYTGRAREGNI